MSTDNFCILPWVHMYVNPDGNVLPCCIGDWKRPLGNTQTNTIEQIWNSYPYKKLRKALLEGKKPIECNACWKHESSGVSSFRQENNKKFEKHLGIRNHTKADGTLDIMKLLYFDVRWSNICNFKCRTCSATYSSSWAIEDRQQGSNVPVYTFAGGANNDNLFDQFKPYLKDIEDFYFAGGEPLITDKHYDILDHLIAENKTNALLQYNTNLSNLNYKKKSIIDYWKQFKLVQVRASLDHYGDRAEYIREGTDWNLIIENLKKVKKECPHVIMSFNTVVSAFNIVTLADFLEYMTDNGFDVNSCTLYNLVEPSHYSLSAVPTKELHKGYDKLKKYYDKIVNTEHKEAVKGVLNFIQNTEYKSEHNSTWKTKNQHYDIIRNRNFSETFPELRYVF